MRHASTVLALLVSSACSPGEASYAGDPSDSRSLEDWISCNDDAVGGDALRSIVRVEYDLHIVEPTFEVDGVYVAERDRSARIDIYADGERVFSEGWEDGTAWQLPGGTEEPEPVSPEGTAALRHGLEQPGHFWTFADMADHGHSVELDSDASSPSAPVLKLTLADGAESWATLDPVTCQVAASRTFAAFHPDVDSTRAWIESRYADHRTKDGITRAWTTHTVDLATGDTIGTTTLRDVRVQR